jgi:alkanesulfonate monooxygenase SsuD/methylene tetrahydromethanopterin reductase-like flavin-dependent oxidoreductase (luciferase family)
MRFGVGMFTGQRAPGTQRTHAELYADLLRYARLVEEVGLDSVWVVEQHFAEDGHMASVLPICAALAAITDRLTIGTSVVRASFYHPIRLAEDAIALDLLSRGRFILGIGPAYREEEFHGMGIEFESDVERLDDTIEILKRAFTGRPFSYTGRYYHVPELTVTPAPFTPGGPRLMLASNGVIERHAVEAAESGSMFMIDPSLSWDAIVRIVELYDQHLAPGVSPELPVFSYGFIAESGEPWARMQEGFSYIRKVYDAWMGRPPVDRIAPEDFRLVLGNVGSVTRQVLAYRRQFGDRLHFIMRLYYPGQDPSDVEAAIRLYGEVAAAVRATAPAVIS